MGPLQSRSRPRFRSGSQLPSRECRYSEETPWPHSRGCWMEANQLSPSRGLLPSPVKASEGQADGVGRPVEELPSLHSAEVLSLEREKDAVRIQAAAVAAQQAALTEEEARLHQCRIALEQQEKQL